MIRTINNTPLADSSMPSKQQIFDAVVQHAARMPKKSMRQVGDDPMAKCCAYRGEDSNACYIGGLLTDAEAAPLDTRLNSNFSSIREEAPDLIPLRFRSWELRHFMTGIQRIHDSEDQEDWPAELRDFAHRNNLSPRMVDEHFRVTKEAA